MEKTVRPSKQSYLLLLLIVFAVAWGIYSLTGGGLLQGKVEKQPTDKEENLSYGLRYIPSSDHILERDGIVLINLGDLVLAKQLSSGVELEAGNISQRSSQPILRMAEHVSYLYLYDGTDVYRIQIGGDGKVHAAVKDCLKFEPMGDYIYSIQEYRGSHWLYRCSLIGSNEKRLFAHDAEDFWAYGGNLLILDSAGQYHWYDVVTQNSLEYTLPDGLSGLALDEYGILYLLNGSLYRRSYLAQDDTLLADEVSAFAAGAERIALLKQDGTVWLCQSDGRALRYLDGKEFPPQTGLDLCGTAVFATQPDRTVWTTPLDTVNWDLVFEGSN